EVQLQETFTANDCFCEIVQTTGAALASCQNDLVSSGADGWCYVDDTHGNPQLVSRCPESEQRQIHFVGAGKPANGAPTFIICWGDRPGRAEGGYRTAQDPRDAWTLRRRRRSANAAGISAAPPRRPASGLRYPSHARLGGRTVNADVTIRTTNFDKGRTEP